MGLDFDKLTPEEQQRVLDGLDSAPAGKPANRAPNA
jgi:hypothetical protein